MSGNSNSLHIGLKLNSVVITAVLISPYFSNFSWATGPAPVGSANIGAEITKYVADQRGVIEGQYKELNQLFENKSKEYGELAKGIGERCVTQTQTAVKECLDSYGKSSMAASAAVSSVQQLVTAQDNLQNAKKAAGKGMFDTLPGEKSASEMAKAAKDAGVEITGVFTPVLAVCEEKIKICQTACQANSRQFSDAVGQHYTEMYGAGADAQPAISNGTKDMEKVAAFCSTTISNVVAQTTTTQMSAMAVTKSASAAMDSLKTWGMVGGAALLGGVALKKSSDKNKEKEKEQKESLDFEHGIIINAKGEKISCLNQDNFTNVECRPALFNYCSKSENAGKGGCVAFQSSYCAANDASVSFCLGKVAESHCKLDPNSDLLKSSPACKWVAERPDTCKKKPETIDCMSSMTPEELTAVCGGFPNDPLCMAHAEGRVVTQPRSNVADTTSSTTTDSTTASTTTTSTSGLSDAEPISGSSSSLSSLVTTTANESISSDPNLVSNFWQANAEALKQLCARGELVNCGN